VWGPLTTTPSSAFKEEASSIATGSFAFGARKAASLFFTTSYPPEVIDVEVRTSAAKDIFSAYLVVLHPASVTRRWSCSRSYRKVPAVTLQTGQLRTHPFKQMALALHPSMHNTKR
jgi:hypothetical protein